MPPPSSTARLTCCHLPPLLPLPHLRLQNFRTLMSSKNYQILIQHLPPKSTWWEVKDLVRAVGTSLDAALPQSVVWHSLAADAHRRLTVAHLEPSMRVFMRATAPVGHVMHQDRRALVQLEKDEDVERVLRAYHPSMVWRVPVDP